MTSLAPKEAKWSAIPLPIPREAPVTMATRSRSAVVVVAATVVGSIVVGLVWVCLLVV